MTVNTDIRDDLTAHDIDIRKLTGSIQSQVERRLDQMAKDVKGALSKHDPFGATRKDARINRAKALDDETKEIVSTAYREIDKLVREDLQRAARVESVSVNQVIQENLP